MNKEISSELSVGTMTQMSPAAQAIEEATFNIDSVIDLFNIEQSLFTFIRQVSAVTLRSAADQVVPRDSIEAQRICAELLSIATELEGSNGL